MPITLYYIEASPPCRAVLMTAKELGITLDLKIVDLQKGEQFAPDFLKINPRHVVPVLDDNGFILTESRAIMTYLVNKYAAGHSLYPADPQKRAQVDSLLYLDIGTITPAQRDIHRPMIFGLKPLDPVTELVYKEKLLLLDTILGDKKYWAGDFLSLADLSVLAILTMAEVVTYDLTEYKNITSWMNRLKGELPYYGEINEEPIKRFKSWYEAKKLEASVVPEK